MLQRLAFFAIPFLLVIPASAQTADAVDANSFSSKKGSWITVYMNDFIGMNYAAGLSKNAACVSEAKKKAGEFMEKGMQVYVRLMMKEMAAFEVNGRDDFVVYCNANGTLLVDMMVTGETANAMARREDAGTPARSGNAPPTITKTQIDLNSGKATATTVTPNN